MTWRNFAAKLSGNLDTSVKQGTRLTGIIGLWPEGPSHRSSNHETNGEIAETPNDEMGSRKERPHLILWTPPPPARDRVNAGVGKVVTIQGPRQRDDRFTALGMAHPLFLNRKSCVAAISPSGKCRLRAFGCALNQSTSFLVQQTYRGPSYAHMSLTHLGANCTCA